VQLGNRDALHLKYSNVIKKNSVPLKEVLTRRRADTSHALFVRAAMYSHHDAGMARIVRNPNPLCCRKSLRRSGFHDARAKRISSATSARNRCNVVNGGVRGLRVLDFGKQKIFERTGEFARSRTRQRRSCCESSRVDSQHARASARVMRRRVAGKEDQAAGCARVSRAAVRGRAWISGDH
jgi:hypothetical protein